MRTTFTSGVAAGADVSLLSTPYKFDLDFNLRGDWFFGIGEKRLCLIELLRPEVLTDRSRTFVHQARFGSESRLTAAGYFDILASGQLIARL